MPRIIVGKPYAEKAAILSIGDQEYVLSATILHRINQMLTYSSFAERIDPNDHDIIKAFTDIEKRAFGEVG